MYINYLNWNYCRYTCLLSFFCKTNVNQRYYLNLFGNFDVASHLISFTEHCRKISLHRCLKWNKQFIIQKCLSFLNVDRLRVKTTTFSGRFRVYRLWKMFKIFNNRRTNLTIWRVLYVSFQYNVVSERCASIDRKAKRIRSKERANENLVARGQ